MSVKSPVTNRRYRVVRVSQRYNQRVGDWRYTGVGDRNSTIDVRFHWKRY